MAYTKIIVIRNRLDRCVSYVQDPEKTALSNTLHYTMDGSKTDGGCFESAFNCELSCATADMMTTKQRWGKKGKNWVQGYHIIQAFAPGEVTPEEAHAIGSELVQNLLGDRYEAIVTTHLDKEHLHNHIVFNSVSFMDGKMYHNDFQDYFGDNGIGIRGTSDALCRKHGLSVIDPDGRGRQYNEWQADKEGRPTVRGLIRQDIDTAVANSFTYRSFLEQLRQMGYTVKHGPNVKHTAVKPLGGSRFIRLDSLGEGYTEDSIQARISAIRSGEPPVPSPAPPPVLPALPLLSRSHRYRIRGTVHQHRPRKLRGFRALYFKYLYLLGTVPRRRPRNRSAFLLREEITKFERYQRQFVYLMKNRIETDAQLTMQHDAIQAKIDALTDQRRGLYNAKRAGRGGEDTAQSIAAITAQLRELRRELKLCVRIEGDLPTVQRTVHTAQQKQRSVAHETADKRRSDRHPGAGADIPAR